VSPSNRVKITAYLVTGAWSVALLILGVKVPGTASKVLGILPIAIVLLFASFDNWLWRLGPVKRLIKQPDLNGTWKGTLTSYRADGTGQEAAHAPIPIFLVIRQSYLSLSITLLSQESRSRSLTGLVQVNHPDDFTVYYHYTNVPGLAHRDRSPVHDGSARLDVAGVSPSSLDGEYWTDRRTRGTFTVYRAGKKRYGTYAEAAAELNVGGN
jgi:SMODS-associating 2TM, beta-strand rich effector domain